MMRRIAWRIAETRTVYAHRDDAEADVDACGRGTIERVTASLETGEEVEVTE